MTALSSAIPALTQAIPGLTQALQQLQALKPVAGVPDLKALGTMLDRYPELKPGFDSWSRFLV
jgi:hypothetical protein